MKVLFLENPEALSIMGGAELQARSTAIHLNRLGVEIEFGLINENLDYSNYDLLHVFNILYHQHLPNFLLQVYKARIAWVTSPILWDLTDFQFLQARKWQKLSTIIGKKISKYLYMTKFRLQNHSSEKWKIQRKLLSSTFAILPNSQMEKDYLLREFQLGDHEKDKIYPIPNGIDGSLFKEKPQKDHEFCTTHQLDQFVLQVGSIAPVKNQLGLIKALSSLPIKCVFIGSVQDQDYFNACKEEAKTQKEKYLFLERVEHEKLPGIYASALAHVLPSWRETPGLVSLEAGASGCAVISTEIGCTKEYFGDMAFYCHPENSATIQSAVVKVLQEPKDNQRLRNHILENFTWENAAQKTFEVYQSILDIR